MLEIENYFNYFQQSLAFFNKTNLLCPLVMIYTPLTSHSLKKSH